MEFIVERPRLSLLLPSDAASYAGPRFMVYFLAAYNCVGTVRSLIHVCASDSGAQSIATMDVDAKSGPNVVAMLGQWGGAQLLMAALTWVVLWRYRGLTPIMIAAVLAEQILRVVVGELKPIVSARTPPGAVSRVVLPVALLAFLLALVPRSREATGPGRTRP
jgi:hypothetical protein